MQTDRQTDMHTQTDGYLLTSGERDDEREREREREREIERW